ncbi:MAG: hypothetical protein HYX76_08260 [Acidobacteria bacterium]|nr:hypothetical protein [Acidobacteriota bacterium]
MENNTPRQWRSQLQRVRAALFRRRLPQQVSRLLVLFAASGAVLLAARQYLVPPTFGSLGHYRAAAVDEIAARPIRYAGRDACGDCHGDVLVVHAGARHQTVACEACHGPAAAHVESGGEAKPRVPRDRSFCPRCHGYDPARPTGFPQIDPIAHNPLKPCFSCHDPHAPVPPNIPASCAACHGEIARVKAVSHHTGLACTECHVASDQHKDTPRLSRPSKPRAREFCGRCHAKDANSPKEIPRIDLATHGPRYLCWQCHYPHDPEVH